MSFFSYYVFFLCLCLFSLSLSFFSFYVFSLSMSFFSFYAFFSFSAVFLFLCLSVCLVCLFIRLFTYFFLDNFLSLFKIFGIFRKNLAFCGKNLFFVGPWSSCKTEDSNREVPVSTPARVKIFYDMLDGCTVVPGCQYQSKTLNQGVHFGRNGRYDNIVSYRPNRFYNIFKVTHVIGCINIT